MNKFISKDLGRNAVSTYKRASNILDKEKNISKSEQSRWPWNGNRNDCEPLFGNW